MSKSREHVLAKRGRLVARAAAEREAVADYIEGWRRPLAIVEGVLAFVRELQSHARLIGFATTMFATVLAIARPRSIGRWLSGGQVAWRIARALLTERRG